MAERLHVTIQIPAEGVPSTADVAVYVEDVSRADAPAGVLAERRERRVRLKPGGTLSLDVVIPTENMDQRRSYSVRVHVDSSGSGEIEKGDLVSTQAHPVLTQGYGREVTVPVKKV